MASQTRPPTGRQTVLVLILLGVTLVGLSPTALSQASVFEGREASAPWGEKGARLVAGRGSGGAWLVVRQTVGTRLEIVAEARESDLFDLQANVLLVRDLHPLAVAATVAGNHMSLLASLFLGPIGMDFGRIWGSGASRWADLWFAPHPQLTLGFGVVERGGRIDPEIAFRWQPACAPHWQIAFRAGADGPGVSLGVWR